MIHSWPCSWSDLWLRQLGWDWKATFAASGAAAVGSAGLLTMLFARLVTTVVRALIWWASLAFKGACSACLLLVYGSLIVFLLWAKWLKTCCFWFVLQTCWLRSLFWNYWCFVGAVDVHRVVKCWLQQFHYCEDSEWSIPNLVKLLYALLWRKHDVFLEN